MKLEGIIGNANAVEALKGMARSGRIPHAMMLYENDGCGAMAIVLAFLGEVFGDEHKVSGLIHPDVHYVYPVASGTKVNEKVQNLRSDLFLKYWRDLMKANPYALESEVNEAFGIEGKQTVINNAEAKEILEKARAEFKAKQAEATKVASTRAVAQAEGTARIYRLDGTPASESSRGLLIQDNKKVVRK